jgi:hypothetical protein
MTYACPTWEFAADKHLLKLQRLQNKVLHTVRNILRRTPVRDLQMAFTLLYIYDYITKLCRQQAEVIEKNENENVRNIGQNITGLNLAAVKRTTVQVSRLPL